jgi:orotate phosphoribosyltransferase
VSGRCPASEQSLNPLRTSPYFFNAGQLYTGSLLASTASAFAAALLSPRIPNFDVLLGPAYKGIPLAAITTAALYTEHKLNKQYCYNRKEKKDVRVRVRL